MVRTVPEPSRHAASVRTLTAILAVAVVVSIVHYTDNYVNYHDSEQANLKTIAAIQSALSTTHFS